MLANDDRKKPMAEVTALRLRLRVNGYVPIPVTGPDFRHEQVRSPGKQPFFKGWSKLSQEAVTPEVIASWPTQIHNHPNTGLLCGNLIVLDIDVLEPGLSANIAALAQLLCGQTPLRRIGRAPKVALFYRASLPLTKMETPELLMPNATKAQVEILGAGQQAVAFGIHPDTMQEYQWPEGSPELMPMADLPMVTEAVLRNFLGTAEALIRGAGGQSAKGQAGDERKAGGRAERKDRQGQGGDTKRAGPHGIAAGSFFWEVNRLALADVEPWFKVLFPTARWQTNNVTAPGMWRVSSADLGRPLEEDISVHPTEGGMDWGTRESCSPIDLAVRWGGAPDATAAAVWLCKRLGLDPAALGWRDRGRKAKGKPAAAEQQQSDDPDEEWPDPIDFLADAELTGASDLRAEHVPDALYPFISDVAARLGVDKASVALSALVACTSIVSDDWSIQPKRFDTTWTEAPRIWGATVGAPSILKTPVIKECTRPIDQLEAEARKVHAKAMDRYKVALGTWKKEGSDPATEPRPPVLDRYMVESTTLEKLSDILRDDALATQRAPAGKLLMRQDEMSEFFANLDRYRSGGSGGGDRGAWLRAFNGGRYTVDRVNRGSYAVPNWSVCILGGIQPGPIQRIARDSADDGLLQQFLFAEPPAQAAGEDRTPDTAALSRYSSLVNALAVLHPPADGFGGQTARVTIHVNGHQHREAINQLATAMAAMPDTSVRLQSAYGKWPGIYARLCLIFHLVELADCNARGAEASYATVIPERTARRVMAYMRDIILPHLLRADVLMFSTAQTGHARWIAGWILSRGLVRVAARDVMQAYGALRAPESRRELQEVMDALVTIEWLRPELQANSVRPPVAWQVNPKIHTVFAVRAKAERDRRRMAQQDTVEAIRRARSAA